MGQLGGAVATNKAVLAVQQAIRQRYGLHDDYCEANAQFDYLFEADESFTIGALKAQAWHVPGHTPSDTAYAVEGCAVFVVDRAERPSSPWIAPNAARQALLPRHIPPTSAVFKGCGRLGLALVPVGGWR